MSLLRKRFVVPAIMIIFLLLMLYSFHRPILVGLASYLIVESELAPGDSIVVISGALPEIHYGIDLYRAGYGDKLLFLGHFPVELAVISQEPFAVMEMNWDEVAAQVAMAAGVPGEALIFSDAFTDSTYERAEAFIEAAYRHDIESLIVVSDEIHTRRLHYSVCKITADRPISILYAPTPQRYYPPAYRFDPQRWWSDESDLKELFGEYIKLVYYWLKY